MSLGPIGWMKANTLMGMMKLHRAIWGRPLTGRDEFNHPFGSGLAWNESYYFNFFDHQIGLGGFTRIGLLPNQQSSVGLLALYPLDESALLFKNDPSLPEDPNVLETGPLVYERIEPMEAWRIRFEGGMVHVSEPRKLLDRSASIENPQFQEVSLDLEFRRLSPVFNYHNLDARSYSRFLVERKIPIRELRSLARVSSHHYEQAGKVKGRMRIGSEEYDFEGRGQRDHSWGLRDWRAPTLWRWLTAQFGTDLALNLSRVVVGRVEIFAGFLCHSGRNYPVRRFELDTEYEPGELIQRYLTVRAEDVSGKVIEMKGEVVNPIPLVLEQEGHRTLVVEAMTRYTWKGQQCYGIAEYLHQLG